MTASATGRYTFDNADAEADRRLGMLAATVDPHTVEVLDPLGVPAGGRCLDVGPGGGTITAWLAARVGPSGRVTALDLEPQHVPAGPNVEVQRGDVRTDPLPAGHYDLAHARLVLMHLPDPDAVLHRLAGTLRPGGRLVVSDWDTSHRDMVLRMRVPAAAAAFDTYQDVLAGMVVRNGGDLRWARRVPLAMEAAGLTGVRTTVHNRLFAGGEPGCLLHESNLRQLRGPLLAGGVTGEQLDLITTAMRDPYTRIYSYPLFSTVGSR